MTLMEPLKARFTKLVSLENQLFCERIDLYLRKFLLEIQSFDEEGSYFVEYFYQQIQLWSHLKIDIHSYFD